MTRANALAVLESHADRAVVLDEDLVDLGEDSDDEY